MAGGEDRKGVRFRRRAWGPLPQSSDGQETVRFLGRPRWGRGVHGRALALCGGGGGGGGRRLDDDDPGSPARASVSCGNGGVPRPVGAPLALEGLRVSY